MGTPVGGCLLLRDRNGDLTSPVGSLGAFGDGDGVCVDGKVPDPLFKGGLAPFQGVQFAMRSRGQQAEAAGARAAPDEVRP